MARTNPRRHAARYVICRIEGIETAEWQQFFAHLTAPDIRFRFGHLVSAESGLRLITLPNRYGSTIFGAFGPNGLVGVANLAKDDTGRAEIGFLVRSDQKRQGIGRALMQAVLCQATSERLLLYGFVHPANDAMIQLMRRSAFVHGPWNVDPIVMRWRWDETDESAASCRDGARPEFRSSARSRLGKPGPQSLPQG
jgi:RimJ/RimL family protein N-acetyltransferase